MEPKAQNIRMLILDVDGVLTDGRFMYTDDGREYKCFHTQDGLGLRMILREGIGVIAISGRTSPALECRARELRLTAVYQGVDDKLSVFEEVLKKNTLDPREVGCVGDDLVDLPILQRVGFAVAVANAVDEVREAADYVTTRPGGHGAVREVCEVILKAQGKWQKCVSRYLLSQPALP